MMTIAEALALLTAAQDVAAKVTPIIQKLNLVTASVPPVTKPR